MQRWAAYLTAALKILLVLFLALATLATYVPAIPIVGIFGSTALNWFGPWIVILSAIATVMGIQRWRRELKAPSLVMAVLAAGAMVGSAVVVAVQWSTARSNGIAIDPLRALYVGPVRHCSGRPEVRTYTRFEGEPLPIQVIRAPSDSAPPTPVLVYVHGGAWVGGVYWMRNHDLRWFADRGITVVSIEYTLSTRSRHMWNVAENQVGCGLARVRANIARYGGDPSRVALIGESAGGNLVINAGYRARNGTLKSSCAGALPPVAAVIANYPAVDLRSLYRPTPGVPTAPFYVGGSPAQFPERYTAISAETHVSRTSPPTLLILGGSDQLVATGPTYRFAAHARSLGVPIDLIDMPYGGHAFDFNAGSIPNQLFREATIRFMTRYGVFPGPSLSGGPPGGMVIRSPPITPLP